MTDDVEGGLSPEAARFWNNPPPADQPPPAAAWTTDVIANGPHLRHRVGAMADVSLSPPPPHSRLPSIPPEHLPSRWDRVRAWLALRMHLWRRFRARQMARCYGGARYLARCALLTAVFLGLVFFLVARLTPPAVYVDPTKPAWARDDFPAIPRPALCAEIALHHDRLVAAATHLLAPGGPACLSAPMAGVRIRHVAVVGNDTVHHLYNPVLSPQPSSSRSIVTEQQDILFTTPPKEPAENVRWDHVSVAGRDSACRPAMLTLDGHAAWCAQAAIALLDGTTVYHPQ